MPQTGTNSKVNPVDELDVRMLNMQDVCNKLKANEQDPLIKADARVLLTKMNELLTKYKKSKSMSKLQAEKTRSSILNDIPAVTKMFQDLKSKYGEKIIGTCCY